MQPLLFFLCAASYFTHARVPTLGMLSCFSRIPPGVANRARPIPIQAIVSTKSSWRELGNFNNSSTAFCVQGAALGKHDLFHGHSAHNRLRPLHLVMDWGYFLDAAVNLFFCHALTQKRADRLTDVAFFSPPNKRLVLFHKLQHRVYRLVGRLFFPPAI